MPYNSLITLATTILTTLAVVFVFLYMVRTEPSLLRRRNLRRAVKRGLLYTDPLSWAFAMRDARMEDGDALAGTDGDGFIFVVCLHEQCQSMLLMPGSVRSTQLHPLNPMFRYNYLITAPAGTTCYTCHKPVRRMP